MVSIRKANQTREEEHTDRQDSSGKKEPKRERERRGLVREKKGYEGKEAPSCYTSTRKWDRQVDLGKERKTKGVVSGGQSIPRKVWPLV